MNSPCTLKNDNECSNRAPPASFKNTGHFTQMMNERLTHIGCAVKACGDGSMVAGCQYGNIDGVSATNDGGILPFNARVAGNLKLSTESCAPEKQYVTLVDANQK